MKVPAELLTTGDVEVIQSFLGADLSDVQILISHLPKARNVHAETKGNMVLIDPDVVGFDRARRLQITVRALAHLIQQRHPSPLRDPARQRSVADLVTSVFLSPIGDFSERQNFARAILDGGSQTANEPVKAA